MGRAFAALFALLLVAGLAPNALAQAGAGSG